MFAMYDVAYELAEGGERRDGVMRAGYERVHITCGCCKAYCEILELTRGGTHMIK